MRLVHLNSYFERQTSGAARLHKAATKQRHQSVLQAGNVELNDAQGFPQAGNVQRSGVLRYDSLAHNVREPANAGVGIGEVPARDRSQVIAVVVTMTKDGPYADGAAVLAEVSDEKNNVFNLF